MLDLGITRDLVRRLVRIFPFICAGEEPLHGTYVATYVEAYRSFLTWEGAAEPLESGPGTFVSAIHVGPRRLACQKTRMGSHSGVHDARRPPTAVNVICLSSS